MCRIVRGIRAAAAGSLYHVWWHPHNVGRHIDENLAFLRAIFEEFARCRDRHQIRSLNMGGVADVIRLA